MTAVSDHELREHKYLHYDAKTHSPYRFTHKGSKTTTTSYVAFLLFFLPLLDPKKIRRRREKYGQTLKLETTQVNAF